MRTVQVGLHRLPRPTKKSPKRRVYALRWHGTDGRYRCETIGIVGKMTERDANRLRAKKEGDLSHGVEPIDKPREMTLEEFVKLDADAIELDRRPATVVQYRCSTRHLMDAIGARRRVSSLTPDDVVRLRRHLKSKGHSANNVNKTLGFLRAAIGRAVERKLLMANPFAGQVRRSAPSVRARVLDRAEIKTLFDHVAGDAFWSAYLRVALTSGLRGGEVAALQWDDIEDDAVHVRRRSEPLEFEPKTHEERTVPIPAETVLAVRRLRVERMDTSPYVFLPPRRLSALQRRTTAVDWSKAVASVSERVRGLQDACGIERPASPKDLRTTYATHMSHRVPPQVLRDWMGHSDIDTTMRYYARTRAEDAVTAREFWSAVAG